MRSYSVVLPVRDDAEGLPTAVLSALSQEPPPERIILCVGPSTDETAQVADRLTNDARVTVLANPHGGIPQALNLGLNCVETPVLLRMDARVEWPPGYAARAVATLCATGAGNVGAVQRPVGVPGVQRAIAAAMRSKVGSGGAAYRIGRELAVVDTAFLGAFDVEKLRSVGGWDELFQRNEDAELNHRLAAHGHDVLLDPQLVVEYRPRSSLRSLGRQYFDYGWWRRRTIGKHRESIAVRQLAAPLLVLLLIASAVAFLLGFPGSLLLPVLYLAAIAGVSATTAELPMAERPQMAAALVVMHFAWGTGFLASTVRQPFRAGS